MVRSCARLAAWEIEAAGPDLIFCIGGLVFRALFESLHEAGWTLTYRPGDVRNYSLGACRGALRVGVGMFHPAEPSAEQNHRWKAIRNRQRLQPPDRADVYDLLDELFGGPCEDYAATVEGAARMERWWSQGVYAAGHQPNPLSACLAVGVADRLVDQWAAGV
jgi:hypothetical protein